MKIGAVLLAAGRSQRFGDGDKLLAEINGRPLISHALAALGDSSVADIAIVTSDTTDGRTVVANRATIATPIATPRPGTRRVTAGTSVGPAASGDPPGGALRTRSRAGSAGGATGPGGG